MSEDREERKGRDSDRGSDAEGAGKRFPSSLIWIAVALTFLFLAQYFYLQPPRSGIQYTEFLEKVEKSVPGTGLGVIKARIGTRKITATVKEPGTDGGEAVEKIFVVDLTADAKDLVAALVPALAQKKIAVEFDREDDILGQALIWLFPLAIIVVAWIWLMRRMGPDRKSVV